MTSFPPVPAEVKAIAHYLKVAEEHDTRNIVVSYWARMHACQIIMKLVPGQKSPEVTKLLLALLEWLETTKKSSHDTEGISDETTAQALIEQYAIQLFTFADAQDRALNFNKNTVKAFYTCGILMDILEQFGELSEDIGSKRKYAKWKAAYIHNCLKAGETPLPGGPDEQYSNPEGTDEDAGSSQDATAYRGSSFSDDPGTSSNPYIPSNPTPPPTTPNIMDEPVNPVAPAPAPSPITPPILPSNPVPFTPAPTITRSSDSGINVGPDVIQKAQKYCKYATSALNYDDVKTAVDNLIKALTLLQTGREDAN